MKAIGHRGAAHLDHENTLAGFETALRHDVDMIEYDVVRTRDGVLVLAHDDHFVDTKGRRIVISDSEWAHLAQIETDAGTPLPTLEEALAHLADPRFEVLEFNCDLKRRGYEREVAETLRAHGLSERTLVSSHHLDSLARVKRHAAELRTGWSYPEAKRDFRHTARGRVAAAVVLAWMRWRFPQRVNRSLRRARCDALMVYHQVVSRALVERVKGEGREVYVWTVDDAERLRRVAELGVDGVASNDPRLFAALR